jgi:hypothetical protein
MRRLLVVLVVLMAFPALFAGCERGNPGPVIIRTYEYADFSKIEVSSAFEVEERRPDRPGEAVRPDRGDQVG